MKINFRTGVAIPCALLQFILGVNCSGNTELTKQEVKDIRDASVLYGAKKFDSAEEKLRPFLGKGAEAVEAKVLYARIKFFKREFGKSEAVLRKILEDDPNNPYALTWLGKVLLVQPGKSKEATDIFRRIVGRNPENYMAHYYLGRSLERRKNLRGALAEYQRALAMEYQVSKIHLHMARMFYGLKQSERYARHAARVRALAVNPRDVASLERLGKSAGPRNKRK